MVVGSNPTSPANKNISWNREVVYLAGLISQSVRKMARVRIPFPQQLKMLSSYSGRLHWLCNPETKVLVSSNLTLSSNILGCIPSVLYTVERVTGHMWVQPPSSQQYKCTIGRMVMAADC